MNREFCTSLLFALAVLTSCSAALPADEWRDEPIRETLLLPVRGAAVGTSLILTTPVEAINGGVRAVNSMMPERTADVELLHVVAAPVYFLGGALLGPVEAASKCAERSWNKPFSVESFGLSD